MPYKHNEPRRHKIPKAKYKVSNWREYDQALRQRGSLTVWVTPEALEAWAPARTGQRGRPMSYSDIVIETAVMLRLAIDPDSNDILAAELTTTGEGDAPLVGPLLDRHPDATVVIPPRSNAVLSDTAETEPTQRDRHIAMLARKGRIGWPKDVGYGKRSLVETAFHRYKVLIGRSLRARTLSTQKVEARIACTVINRMTSLGMPVSRKVA
jgi:hypothetical protein